MVKYMDNNRNPGFMQWSENNRAAAPKKSFLSGMLWWTVLLIAAWWAVGWVMGPKKADVTPSETMPVADLSAVQQTSLTSEKLTATVQGLRISDVRLADFAADADDMSGPRVGLLAGDGEFAEIGYVATGATAPTPETQWKISGDTMTWRSPNGVEFTRVVTITDGYVINVTDTIQNKSASTVAFAPYARIVRGADNTASAGISTGAVVRVNDDIEYADWRQMDKRAYAYSTTRGFAGFADQYWETIASIDAPDQTIRARRYGPDFYISDASAAAVSVAPGATQTIVSNLYAGPRAADSLSLAATQIAGIDDTMDYGWFWFLAMPLLWVLNWLNALVHNYGLAIILLTLLLRAAMWPLTRKSYTSMMAMQRMQPEMARIQKLYANDKARLQLEMMRLYQTHKTSPMSGCLPMLIQIPIFFALYKALLVSVQMRSAHFLWISDLAAMDPYFILPILMGATMWLQQYLQGGTQNKNAVANDVAAQTQRAMRWMPILFTVMFAWMPAGLVLYWTVSNLFGIAQMYIIKRRSK